jgi:NTP pyrophosphatase (non-canonical NTP hydrolase)
MTVEEDTALLTDVIEDVKTARASRDKFGDPFEGVYPYFRQIEALIRTACIGVAANDRAHRDQIHGESNQIHGEIANADASKVDLDTVAGQLPALKKIEHDLAYRIPGSGRPLSHSVISRRQAEELVEMVERLTAGAQASTFSNYQETATGTAIYPGRGVGLQGISYCTIKLGGEVGEICEKVGKLLRDTDGVLTAERRDALILEMGDVCWYLAALATELNVPLAEVFQRNVEKITSRKARGVIGGNGDNR